MNSKKDRQKSGNLVTPGERLAVIEEFIPDLGTYEQDGIIYSKIIGQALIDYSNRRVSVYPVKKEAIAPKSSSTVIGEVGHAQSDNVLVKIRKIGEKKLSGVFTGILHISDVQDRYVSSMDDVAKPGDTIRSKVKSYRNQRYHLSTTEKDLGVVYAFCSKCGGFLEQKDRQMRCSGCGRIERRKAASDYGKEALGRKETELNEG